MIIQRQEDVTPKVLDAYSNIEDPRLREIVASLIKHLHAFAREVHLTGRRPTHRPHGTDDDRHAQ